MNESPVRYFYDLEFLEDGRTIELISIGIVAVPDWAIETAVDDPNGGDGRPDYAREYYAVNADAPWDRIHNHQWLMANVWPHLPVKGYTTHLVGGGANIRSEMKDRGHLDMTDTRVKPKWVIANEVREFILAPLLEADDRDPVPDIELWADYGAYDHVALCQLWGPMVKLPTGIPMFTHDLRQYRRSLGDLGYPDRAVPRQQPEDAHDALADARHNRRVYEAFRRIEKTGDNRVES